MSVNRPRLFVLSITILACVLGLGFAPREAAAVDLDSARQDLDMLKKSRKARATNDDLFQYLDQVFAAFKDPDMPEPPADDASPEEKKAHDAAMAKAKKLIDKFRSDAEKTILSIMTIAKVERETNTRDAVNTRAAAILGEMGDLKNPDGTPMLNEKDRKDLSKKIMQAIEKKLTKVKTHTVSTDHLDAAFAALGKLNDMGALAWMVKNYTHAIDNRKEYLVAAHKAMVLFKNVPGKLRKEVCDSMVKTYAGVESQAQQKRA